jgi:peptidoglycan glycosyltransferase
MDRPVRRLFLFFSLLFVALVLQLTWVQVVSAPKLKVEPTNTRAIQEEMQVERGSIISAEGVVLADNKNVGGYFYREYPQGSLTAPWLGYNSLQYGRAGIERIYNEDLSGQSGTLGVTSELDKALGRTHQGADLKLTISLAVQEVAAQALGNRKGAVIALDPRTGAVLAMVSYPRYDPNELEKVWKTLSVDEGRPLLNRVTQGLYPPGSAFKMIVAAAALEKGAVTPATSFDDTGTFTAGGYVVSNYDDQIYGAHDFTRAFSSSINTTFAKLGVAMGADALSSYARAFGFGEQPPWDLGGADSRFPDPGEMDDAHVAQAAFGQGEVLASPLEMALVTAAVANGGKIMKPYIVHTVTDSGGRVLKDADPTVWLQPISSQTAATMRTLMVEVVKSGTGTAAALKGVQVAGKTGTAEVAEAEPHAWFAGFAPAENPSVVVVVLVENAGTGGKVAAPIARKVIAAVLGL